MTMPIVPPPPPRPRSQSGEVDVYQKLISIEVRIANLEQGQAIGNAGRSNQTLQLLIGGVVAIVTAVIGARVTAPTPPPSQVIQAPPSAYDRARESCMKLSTDPERAKCVLEVTMQSMGPTPR